MKNKKISKLTSGVLIPLASFPLFLPVSANTVVNADASVVDGFNQINHYNYEDKYTADLFWTSKYRIHTDIYDKWDKSFRNPNYPNDLDNYIQIHDASVSGFNPVSLTDSTKLSSTAWKIEGNNTWWANSDIQNRQTGKKYLIRFNANRPKLHEGFLVGSVYFSKDLALTGELKITLRDKNNLNNIFQTRSFTISETQLTNNQTGILNRFLNLRQNINTNPTSNPQIWSIVYNPGYSEAPNTINIEDRKKIEKTNEYRFLNSNYADNTSYRLNVDTNRSGAIANFLINRRYKNRFELWDSDLFSDSSWRIDPKNWEQGGFNKYLNGNRQPYDTWYLNSPSLSSLRNESSTNPYTAISKNGGALLLVYANELFYGKNYLSYIMDIEFEIKPNIFEDGTIPLDFNSKGESFFGVSSMTPQNSQDRYQDNYNRIVSGKDYDKRYYWTTGLIRHSDRKETTAIQFITNESMSSEVDASDLIPSSSILKVYRTGNTPDNTILPDDRNKLIVDRTNLPNSANKRSFKTKNSFILEPSTIIPNPSKTYRDELKKWTNDWLYLEVSLNETNDQMKWKPIINTDKKFTTSRTNAGYVEQNITWDYTDYEKLRRHINSKQWLTKAQKDHYLQKILNAADKNNYYSISEFESLKNEIDKHDKAQMDVEEAYNEVVNYVLNNKTKFIFASENKKQEVVNILNNYWEVGSFKSSFSNNNDRFLKRDEFTKFKTVTFLNDSLRTINYYINNLTNLDGDSRINAYKTSIEKINVIKDSTYNKAKFQKFLTEIQNDAVQELTLITPTVYGKNNIASLTALKQLWTSPWMNLNYWDKLDELKTSIQTTNSIYEKAKIINQEIQNIKTASTLTGDNSQNYYWYNYLQKFNDLSINSLWKGYFSLQTLATKENDWNELYKRIIGTSATDSNNIFSDAADKYKKDDNTKYIPENLKNISTLKTNYEETFRSLVDSLDFSFGNGARLVEEFEKYTYLDKTILRKYWSKTSTQKTYYFGDLRNIYNNNTQLNLRNFSISSSDALTLIKPDQTAVTNALKSISNHAYNLAADAIKTKIDNLSDLTKTRKQYYKSEIDKIVTAKSSVLYKNDTDFTSLWNAAQDEDTEQARINQIANQLASVPNKFDYSNKSQTLVDNAIYTNFNVINPQQYQNVRIEMKKVAQKDPIITGGRAKVNYVVYSTKAQYTHLASYHKTNDGSEAITDVNNEAAWFTSDWVTDFKADEVREKARLEALSLQFSNKHNKIHLPSEINTSNFNNEIGISNSDTQTAFNPATEEVIIETLTPNDKEGTLSFTYKIRSKQITNPIVETTQKSATVITTTNKFKTEVDRLNEVLAQISATLKTEIANKANRLPSQVQNNEIEFNDLASQYNAKVILSNLSSNNDTGVLNVTYKLRSTRPNYTDVVSTNTKDLTESGFLTLLEQKRREVLKLVNDSTLLTEPEKTDFRNQVNSAGTIPKLNALEQKIKIAELVNKVDEYTYLNNAQANHVKDQIRASRDYESANLIYNDASDLNDSMKELHEEAISELSQLTNKVISDDQDTSDKVNVNYTLASADKKSTYDNALRTAQTLLNKANGANESNPDNITLNLSTVFAQLDGTQNETRLHNQIDALTNLNTTQKSKLKASISRSKSLSDAEAIVTKATDLDTAIANLEAKINEAQGLKTKTIYTAEDNKGPFDSALSTATKTLNNIKSNDLDSFGSALLEAKATELANKTADLTTAIANLDGERKQFKNDLKTKWNLLEETEINNLVQKVDSIPKTDFNDTKKAQIIQEGFDLAKTKARTRLSSTSLPNNEFLNLNKTELDGYVELVNLQSSNPKTTGKYDQKIADQLNNAKADNKTKQDAIDAINTLDTLTQDQKNIFINSVKDQVVASALKHQNDATELNNAMKDLKNVVLEKAKDLADDDTLEHTNMFNAAKTDKKYRLADTDKQTAYNNKLTQIQTAVSKSNVQKSEIEGLKQPFLDAFNALNGEDNETRLHNQINALSRLTLDQKTNLKKIVSDANSLVDAKAIVAKATTLNDAITTLEAKIAKAKEVKGQPIYIGEDNKTPFDDALSGAESALSTLKSNNLESSSAVDLQSKATDLSTKETALQNAIDNLDGIRKQFKKDLSQKWILLDESEKNAL
ncbi:GA module-containing protein, partial [Mycoplasmopsis pullorum]|uniref:GA module-containing protein n=1 Tax=Mycoplasmopsis pullorum TaxID=48003 RepID=UPI00111B5B44